MACLGSVLYDPAGAVTKATSSLAAMTAFDTTNARITFTAPANGKVLVKLRCSRKGASTSPQILLGVLDGATVRGRQAPVSPSRGAGSTTLVQSEASFVVNGLTSGNSYSFDAAYGVETVVASTTLGYGGANDTTASNAYGALCFEVWETTNLLGAIHYDPATAASVSTATASVMAAIDTTNLRLSFTTAASGAGSTRVAVRLRTVNTGNTSVASFYLGVIENSPSAGTIRMRQAAWCNSSNIGSPAATDLNPAEAFAVINGLSPSTSYTWDAAWGTETLIATSVLKWGGPDNATTNDAWGGISYEIWKA